MSKYLQNIIVLIIGNAGGTTREIADKFLKEGAKLIILLDADEIWGKETQEQLNCKYGKEKAVFAVLDIKSDIKSIPVQLYEKYGHYDAAIMNFGIIEESDRKNAFDLNIFWPIQYALKYWRHVKYDKGRSGGTILFVTSSCAFKVNKFLPIYQTAAYALIGFTRSLGHTYNYERTGIRILTLCRNFTGQEINSNLKVMRKETNENYQNYFDAFLAEHTVEQTGVIGEAIVEIYKKADSGTTWLISDGKPVKTEKIDT